MNLVYGSNSGNFSDKKKLVVEFDPVDLFLEVGLGDTTESDVKKFINKFKGDKKLELIKEISNSASKLDTDSSDIIDHAKYLGALKVMKVVNSLQ